MAKLTSDRIRIIKTCNLYISVAVSGMCLAMVGPTLLDLQHMVQTDTQHIALLYTARSCGYLGGSLIGGAIFDAVQHKQVVLTVLTFLISVSVAVIPWSRSIGMLAGTMVFNGVAISAMDTGSNVCIFNYWGKDSAPFYQALHFTYGLGALMAPLIAVPFLGNFTEDYQHDGPLTSNVSHVTNLTTAAFLHPNATTEFPTIVYPYAIVGVLGFLTAFLFLAMAILAPIDYNAQKEQASVDSKNQSRCFIVLIVSLTWWLLFVETGTELGYANMLTTYAVKGSLHLSKTTGSYMTSVFWLTFTLSRFASIFLAMKVSNLGLIVFDLVMTWAGGLVLYFFALHHEWGVWAGTALLGIGIASFWPSVVAWVEEYITATNKIVSLLTMGAAFGEMVVPYAISSTIDQVPDSLVYVVLATCVTASILVATQWAFLRKRHKKYVQREGVDNRACVVKDEQSMHKEMYLSLAL